MKKLVTERLILRDWYESDKYDLYEYAKDPEVGPKAGWKPHKSTDESLNLIRTFIVNQNTWAVELKDERKVIGSVGLHRESYYEYLSLGYVIGHPYWGRGYAFEAAKRVLDFIFEETDIRIVAASHYPGNIRSKRVIDKCGFVFEGILRQYCLQYNGEAADLFHYSITKEEWKMIRQNEN